MQHVAKRWACAYAPLLDKTCLFETGLLVSTRGNATSSSSPPPPSPPPNGNQQTEHIKQQHEASSSSDQALPAVDVRSTVESFRRDPHTAASTLVGNLSPAERMLLAAALAGHDPNTIPNDQKYKEDLLHAVDTCLPPGSLSRREFQRFLVGHDKKEVPDQAKAPSSAALRMVFFASALPFVGFGFLDNFIMLLAGEEIDAVFGARLGLTTLASAGLGNLVADVIGVGAASAIEQMVRRAPFIKNPSLSRAQMEMKQTKYTKAIGASLGVMLGCLLGLVPLLMSGHFFVPTVPH
eukprot:gene2357-8665_t